ncbi:lipid-A-disaccharide synthase [Hypnocyclicus thermotrophus]|uniref:Lipid-A-disaccharide synthase n=1 Tax=Hypnocyclicus thermotrophus TaxID=1627895 RepID=A0AA46DZL7_9FUSO|nr:lipid-A-disaccharide synthase [Hypnocyclicus thermotrophus]TDT71882.1 lipid-A-disaccharide synthase [Hypnocyclicus thermotrophus]
MKYFVSTGELSGDVHLSYLLNEIKNEDKNAEFYGMAGDNSKKVGVNLLQHIDDIAVMGFKEAAMKYNYLKKKLDFFINFILKNNIKKVILVDYGGFNIKFLEKLKQVDSRIKVYYYIPPKVWIWGEKRVEKLKLADKLLVIFPWELEFYKNKNIDVKYYGNPFIEKYKKIEKKGEKILILPGSRKQEITKILPTLLKVVDKLKNEKFILKLANKKSLSYIKKDLSKYHNLEVSYDELNNCIKKSKYAIATSGTVVLELALLGLPGIVVYKTSIINEIIVRLFIKLKYVSLPNLTLNEEVYPELLQNNFNLDKIIEKIEYIEKNKKEINKKINEIRNKLGGKNIVKKYAQYIINN